MLFLFVFFSVLTENYIDLTKLLKFFSSLFLFQKFGVNCQ